MNYKIVCNKMFQTAEMPAYQRIYFDLESLCISANAAAQCEFFASWWMHYVQRTVFAEQLLCFRPGRTFGEFVFRYIGQSLEVVVARVTEMRRTEAEVNRHRAAEPALVFQVIGAVLRTHLRMRKIHFNSERVKLEKNERNVEPWLWPRHCILRTPIPLD